MAKITELEPSDSEGTTPSKSSKECKGELKSSSRPVQKEQKPASVSLQNTTGTLYINYIALPIIIVIISVAVLFTTNQTALNQSKDKIPSTSKKGIVMSAEELAKHDGSDPNIPVYIVILGRVYDVEKGRRHYAKGSGYNVFAGRDSTPSFVTGVFSREKASDDVKGLGPEEMLGIKDWIDFYRKDYTYIGKVVGRYYDESGNPTASLKQARALIKEGKRLKEVQKGEDRKFPPCNSKWSQDEGAEVWCSNESGGIHRGWAGVPRQYFKPGSRDPNCVCVRTTGVSSDTRVGDEGDLNHPNLKLYPGCKKMDVSCEIES